MFPFKTRLMACSVLMVVSAHATVVRADAFEAYALVGQFELPDGDAPYDVLDDGRLVTVMGDEVYIESALGSRAFILYGVLAGADIASFGAAFVRVSPDGQSIAVGNNGGSSFVDFEVGVFDFGTLTGTWFVAGHFQASWFDNTHVALSAGDFGSPSFVTMLDTTSGDPVNPDNPTIINNVGGASAGVSFDGAGRLFTGNGFTGPGPSGTGAIKAFDSADWLPALSGGMAVDFESAGILVADVLSASPLRFDSEAHLLVGGGDTVPDADAIAIVRNSAVATALAGGGAAEASDPTAVRYLDPLPDNDFNFFSVEFNDITGELYVRDFAATTVYVYVADATVPTVSEWGLLAMAAGLGLVGGVVVRRRAPGIGG